MRRWALGMVLAACVALSGCGTLVQSEYVYTQAHNAPAQMPQTDALTVETRAELQSALRSLIENGVEHGVIRVYNYTGNVEEDLTDTAYAVWRVDPLGAYAVDYIAYSCSLIVSYYEISVDITYRRTQEQITALEYLSTDSGLEAERLLRAAVEDCAEELTVYYSYYTGRDPVELVRAYYDQAAGSMMAMPQMQVTVYPETGVARIVEVCFSYPESAAQLRQMQQAVAEELRAAAVYSRYSSNETDHAQLLLTYLSDRFDYREQSTDTPVYSLLCEGVGTSESAAKCWQLLCEEAGLNCYTVRGIRSGAEYWWNILQLDGKWYHVDLLRDLLDGIGLRTYSDLAMGEYYWDAGAYPVCPDYSAESAQDVAEEGTPESPQSPTEETDVPPVPDETDAEEKITNRA